MGNGNTRQLGFSPRAHGDDDSSPLNTPILPAFNLPTSSPVKKTEDTAGDETHGQELPTGERPRLKFAREAYVDVCRLANPNICLSNVVFLDRKAFLKQGKMMQFEEIPGKDFAAGNALLQHDIVLFVCHQWQDASRGYPDDEMGNIQYQLITLFLKSPQGKQVTKVWLDYSCIAQESEQPVGGSTLRSKQLAAMNIAILLSDFMLVIPRIRTLEVTVGRPAQLPFVANLKGKVRKTAHHAPPPFIENASPECFRFSKQRMQQRLPSLRKKSIRIKKKIVESHRRQRGPNFSFQTDSSQGVIVVHGLSPNFNGKGKGKIQVATKSPSYTFHTDLKRMTKRGWCVYEILTAGFAQVEMYVAFTSGVAKATSTMFLKFGESFPIGGKDLTFSYLRAKAQGLDRRNFYSLSQKACTKFPEIHTKAKANWLQLNEPFELISDVYEAVARERYEWLISLMLPESSDTSKIIGKLLPRFTSETDRSIAVNLLANFVSFCTSEFKDLQNRPAITKEQFQSYFDKPANSDIHILSLEGKGLFSQELKELQQILLESPLKVDSPWTIRLDGNPIGYHGLQQIMTSRYIDFNELSINKCGIGDAGAWAFPQLLKEKECTVAFLSLEDNNIGCLGCGALAGLSDPLTILNVSKNAIGSKGASHLAQNNSITDLNLEGNNIGNEGGKALAKNEALTALNLAANNIGSSIDVMRFFAKNSVLTSLNLKRNSIGDMGVVPLEENTTLTSLNLSSNGVGDLGAKALAQTIMLTSLDLSHNHIGPEGGAALLSNTLMMLKTLNLRDNHVGDEGVLLLAINTTLTELDLSNNYISEDGAKAIAMNSTLKSLNLENHNARHISLTDNFIGDEGAKAFQHNSSITSLNLGKNNIGNTGALALAQNKKLINLCLQNNRISDAAVKALAANTILKDLNLRSNNISDGGAVAFSQNKTLTALNLDNNNIGYQGAKALSENVALCPPKCQEPSAETVQGSQSMSFLPPFHTKTLDDSIAAIGNTEGDSLVPDSTLKEVEAEEVEDKHDPPNQNQGSYRPGKSEITIDNLGSLEAYCQEAETFLDLITAEHFGEGNDNNCIEMDQILDAGSQNDVLGSHSSSMDHSHFSDSDTPEDINMPINEDKYVAEHEENHLKNLSSIDNDVLKTLFDKREKKVLNPQFSSMQPKGFLESVVNRKWWPTSIKKESVADVSSASEMSSQLFNHPIPGPSKVPCVNYFPLGPEAGHFVAESSVQYGRPPANLQYQLSGKEVQKQRPELPVAKVELPPEKPFSSFPFQRRSMPLELKPQEPQSRPLYRRQTFEIKPEKPKAPSPYPREVYDSKPGSPSPLRRRTFSMDRNLDFPACPSPLQRQTSGFALDSPNPVISPRTMQHSLSPRKDLHRSSDESIMFPTQHIPRAPQHEKKRLTRRRHSYSPPTTNMSPRRQTTSYYRKAQMETKASTLDEKRKQDVVKRIQQQKEYGKQVQRELLSRASQSFIQRDLQAGRISQFSARQDSIYSQPSQGSVQKSLHNKSQMSRVSVQENVGVNGAAHSSIHKDPQAAWKIKSHRKLLNPEAQKKKEALDRIQQQKKYAKLVQKELLDKARQRASQRQLPGEDPSQQSTSRPWK